MHYFNRSLYYFERDNNKDALLYIKKSNDYYRNLRSEIIEGSILRNLIVETEYSDISIVNYLLRYYKISKKKKEKDHKCN